MNDRTDSPLRHRLAALLVTALIILPGCGDSAPSEEAASGADPSTQGTDSSREGDEPGGDAVQLAEAQRLLGEGSFTEAAEILQSVVESSPDNATAWQLLGVAQRNAGNLEAAKQAYQRSYEFPANRGNAVMGLMLVSVALDELDEARRWLDEAKQTPGVDFATLATHPALQGLEGDDRFAELFPDPAIYESSPFVEPVDIVHEWRGEAGDAFGWVARTIGDVDGDGTLDAAVTGPGNAPPGDNIGRVDLFSGGSGALLWQVRGAAGEQLGVSVEAAGDTNADGVPDVIAGAPGAGTAYVYSGRDGSVLQTLTAPDGASGFANSSAGVGDVDGDGHSDVVVGAPGDGSDPSDPGKAFVFSGSDGSVLLALAGQRPGDRFGSAVAGGSDDDRFWLVVGAPDGGAEQRGEVRVYTTLTSEPAFVFAADETGGELGAMFLSVVGDVDRDGTPDVYGSDWQDQSEGPLTGRIYVHSGKTGERLLTLAGNSAGEGFGIGPARAGDLNGDGADDLVVGAWQHGSAAFSGGRVYLYSGLDGALLGTITCRVPGDTFGFDADGLGDVDGDGVHDLLLTSAWSLVTGPRAGRTFVISGKSVLGQPAG